MEKTETTKESKKTTEAKALEKAKQSVINAIDENGNGAIDIEDIIIKALKIPGIKIERSDFLRAELNVKYPESVIEAAISETPSAAGIDVKVLDKIADNVIQRERVAVSGISAVLGLPGSFAMLATIPADIAQYYGYMLRTAQKLMYLYGFPQAGLTDEGNGIDSETINMLTLCLGVMYGVAGANNAGKTMAKALATGVPKQILKRALTKGTIYPIVKQTAKWFGVKMTKDVFAGFFKKSIPVVGVVVGGGLTYLTFKPCCEKLKNNLRKTKLVNPNDDSGDVIDLTKEEAEIKE